MEIQDSERRVNCVSSEKATYLGTIKYFLFHIFYSFCAPQSYPHKKGTRSYGTVWKFTNWLYYQFKQIFQNSYQYFQSCTAFLKKLQHTVKQVQDMPLKCHYTIHVVLHVSIAASSFIVQK